MTDLKLQIRKYLIPNEQLASFPKLDILELVAHLDLKMSTRCNQDDFFKYEQIMKKQIAANFKQKLYGQIIRAINKLEQETMISCFNYSAENKMKEAFQELRNSIPEITYD